MEEPIFPHHSPKTAAVVVTPQNLFSITIDESVAHQEGTGAAFARSENWLTVASIHKKTYS